MELPGKWQEYKSPFRHYTAKDVLGENEYLKTLNAFNECIIKKKETLLRDGHKQNQYYEKYDAIISAVTNQNIDGFSSLISYSFVEALGQLIKFPFNGLLDAAIHSHPLNSRSGWIHTDYCSAWFNDPSFNQHCFCFADRSKCDYFSGKKLKDDAMPVEYARVGTLIYFLGNDKWQTGYGGETVLFNSSVKTSNTRTKFIAPENNTLLFFECSPHSYHSFITNVVQPRNSIIFWLHCTVEDAQQKWPQGLNRTKSI